MHADRSDGEKCPVLAKRLGVATVTCDSESATALLLVLEVPGKGNGGCILSYSFFV